MRVVIAPDSFKGSITATAAAAALAAGWQAARPADQVTCLPLADGGEGTLEVLAAGVAGARWRDARVTGPGGAPVACQWLQLPGGAAAVELARASGLPLLARPDPMRAQTTGLGELIGITLDEGAGRLLIGLGGSAATDGGTGALARLAMIDTSGLRPPPASVICLTDVTAPLLGPAGAAAVFGPQKGATPGQVARLEAGLTRLAGLLGGDPGAPGAGAAGGTGYGLAAGWRAVITPGGPELARLAGLGQAIAAADLVITGEGRFDPTSLAGKTAGLVLAAAADAGVPAAIVAGDLGGPPPAGVAVLTLAALAGGTRPALADPARWLRAAGQQLARRRAGEWPGRAE